MIIASSEPAESPPRAGSVRDWVSHAAGQRYGALYSALPKKAGTQGCARTLCALLTSLDVANGMKLLHKYKILHSDLKPHNVLLCSSHKARTRRRVVGALTQTGCSERSGALASPPQLAHHGAVRPRRTHVASSPSSRTSGSR